MSIPGLNLSVASSAAQGTGFGPSGDEPSWAPTAVVETKSVIALPAEEEYRFTAPVGQTVTMKLNSGSAEIFGTDMASSHEYVFSGARIAVYTWNGCEIEVSSVAKDTRVDNNRPMYQYANVHHALEDMRSHAQNTNDSGPQVLVLGPQDVGKTSICKTLLSSATRVSRVPVIINLDPQEGVFSIPGALSITAIASPLDPEQGWGTSPVSGPSASAVKTPLCYPFCASSPLDSPDLFKHYVSKLGRVLVSRYEDEPFIKNSGCIIDTSGSLCSGHLRCMEIVCHIIAEFSINVILLVDVADSMRNELRSRFGHSTAILQLQKSSGCMLRDQEWMQHLREAQVREYFYGPRTLRLEPFSQQMDFHQVSIFRVVRMSSKAAFKSVVGLPSCPNDNTTILQASHADGDERKGDDNDAGDDEEYDPSKTLPAFKVLHERISPSQALRNAVLAVTHADANCNVEQIKDASTLCYIYISDVDEVKRRLKILSPLHTQIPTNALVWGEWPDSVADIEK